MDKALGLVLDDTLPAVLPDIHLYTLVDILVDIPVETLVDIHHILDIVVLAAC
ncbi:hypothetical protein [Peribacillus glennii]|uniref:hypothetical protein n=1 Tax=Peribacillus glennii TaxID=2303991 RepID=UPI001314A09A|nr:hypothetical protein [Peribacillus glennii]